MRLLTAILLCLVSHSAHADAPVFTFLGASSADMDNPHDVKLTPDGRYLFVSDVGGNRVILLDPESLVFVDAFGADHQAGTHDVDWDAAGRVFVADTHNNRVTIYRMEGTKGILIGELTERIRGPEGVLAHPNGRLYVGAAWSDNVVAYENGKPVAELVGLSSPHDLEVTPEGRIWLADAGNDRMLLLTQDLKVLKEWSGAPYEFDGVRYMDILPDGSLIVADKNSHRILVIAADGRLLTVLGEDGPGEGPGVFQTPEGVETRGDIVWIADSGNDRVVKYRLTFP